MQAMLLAAGLGTRLRPYSLIRPKPLFPILNQPLLLILLRQLKDAGCSRIVVNAHHLASQIREAIAGIDEVVYQYEPEILGTGGSLRQALPRLADEPLLVVNGDIFHNVDLQALYTSHLQSGRRLTMAMHDCPRFNTVGVREDRISTFHAAAKKREDESLAFTGIYVIDPTVIRMIPEGRFVHSIDMYEELLVEGESIGSHRVDGSYWHDIGTPDDYLTLHDKLLSQSVCLPLPLQLPAESWLIDQAAAIGDKVDFSGWGCVGRASIGNGARLRNCVVWDGAGVPAGAVLENRIVSPHA